MKITIGAALAAVGALAVAVVTVMAATNGGLLTPAIPFVNHPITEWEHGWKSAGITATRINGDMGQSIGFDFTGYANDADRAEVSDFMRYHGCSIYQGGGYAGATAYTSCKDVTDKASADAKIKSMLPDLEAFMEKLSTGLPIVKTAAQLAADKADDEDFWKHCQGISMNGGGTAQYKCDSATRSWVLDQEATQMNDDREAKRRALWMALKTRVLTPPEMKEVANYGISLNVDSGVPYTASEKLAELQAALTIQQILQLRQQPQRGGQ